MVESERVVGAACALFLSCPPSSSLSRSLRRPGSMSMNVGVACVGGAGAMLVKASQGRRWSKEQPTCTCS